MTAPIFAARGAPAEIEQGCVLMPKFGPDGLITAIAQDATTGDILMVAHMNAEALALTLSTRTAHFWTRSRQRLWKKGEDSGNTLTVLEARTDCDQDVLLLKVTVNGDRVACHTGSRSCFYRTIALSPPHGLARVADE
jgi:phosphoribosyl-AMP cyclohydrolase